MACLAWEAWRSSRDPGHCITQVALSDQGSPGLRSVLTLGMMKSQLLSWREERRHSKG